MIFRTSRFLKTSAVAIVMYLGCAGAGQAALIVDTGPGTGASRPALWSNQWLAAEFSLGAPAVLTNVQGWMLGVPNPGTATAAIYTAGGDVPGLQVFAASFTANATADWYGPSGFILPLAAGTYWVAFEVRAGNTLFGEMPSPSPMPLGNEAFNANGGMYGGFDSTDIGVRISGDTLAAIPEPSTYALMLAGLGFVGFMAHRRRKQPAADSMTCGNAPSPRPRRFS